MGAVVECQYLDMDVYKIVSEVDPKGRTMEYSIVAIGVFNEDGVIYSADLSQVLPHMLGSQETD